MVFFKINRKLIYYNNIYLSIIIFYLVTLINSENSQNNENKFQKLIKLPSEEFFIIFENGIYIYNSNFTTCKPLYFFQDTEKIMNSEDSINTLISEIKNGNEHYVISLAKKYLYIYNFTKNNLIRYQLSQLNTKKYNQKGVNYNLIPYEIDNFHIKFIISFLYDNMPYHKIFFLYFNIKFLEKSIECKEIFYKDTVILGTSDLSPFNISCQISSFSPIY